MFVFGENVGLTEVGKFFHQFDGEGGVTGMIVLAESHMSLHTWPEKICDIRCLCLQFYSDNREKAKNLLEHLKIFFNPQIKTTKKLTGFD